MFNNIDSRIQNIRISIGALNSKVQALESHVELNPTDQQSMLAISISKAAKHRLESRLHILTVRAAARQFCDKNVKI